MSPQARRTAASLESPDQVTPTPSSSRPQTDPDLAFVNSINELNGERARSAPPSVPPPSSSSSAPSTSLPPATLPLSPACRAPALPADAAESALKTSATHPINVSFIVPESFLDDHHTYHHVASSRGGIDLLDLYQTPVAGEEWPTALRQSICIPSAPPGTLPAQPPHGNLVLSSCPGKKVRLDGPSRGRARINRDLESDLRRIAGFGITTVVCCLNDAELSYLGAPWNHYREVSSRLGLEVIRLPMIEGSVPEREEDLDNAIEMIDERLQRGGSVLAHCRGGVGRAGVVACCWLIRRGYARTAVRAIQLVRARRSWRAIETRRQEDCIAQYEQRWRLRREFLPAPAPPPPAPPPNGAPSVNITDETQIVRIEPDGSCEVSVEQKKLSTAESGVDGEEEG